MNERYFKNFETQGTPLNIDTAFQLSLRTGDWSSYKKELKKEQPSDMLEMSRLLTKNGITNFREQAEILVHM